MPKIVNKQYAAEIVESITNKFNDTTAETGEQFFYTSAYTLGTLITQACDGEDQPKFLIMMVEAMGKGLMTGMQLKGDKSDFSMVIGKVPK